MNKLFSLEEKKIVITGAGGFFGVYFSKALLDAGVRKLYMVSFNKNSLSELKVELLKRYDSARMEFLLLDQYDKGLADKMFNTITEKDDIDVLINNSFDFSIKTGFNDSSGRIENATFEQLQNSFESGVYWPFQATQIFSKNMIKAKNKGSIINIASMYAFVAPNPTLYEGKDAFNPPGYSMAKGALLALTRYSASFYGKYGIRVNTLSPGAIPNTEKKTNNSEHNKDDEFMKRLSERTLLGRVGHPNDLIGALIFLASDSSSYMTGQSIIIDGGWVIT